MIGEDNQSKSSEEVEKTEKVEETKKDKGHTYLESRNRKMQQKIDADMMKEMFIYTHMRN